MSERHIGLDIGSFAVRAAEVSIESGRPTLHRFAQVTLPPGAVVEGHVTDSAVVGATIRELWLKGGFKSKKVIVGISTPDVKVRQADVPALDPDEVRGTLRYEAQDLIPFAGADTVFDFVIQDRFHRDGADMLRVLVVAAPREHIDTTVAAVSAAGLQVEGVDLVPFALARSLSSRQESGGEVIVSVGAGLTSVVVQSGGVPQQVRTTPGGGGTITEALATRLSVGYEQAEAVKRMASPHTPEGATATALIDEQLTVLVREIVGSVDYFLAQTAEVDVRRIILTGAGSLVPGLRERIRAESHLDVVPADALRNVALGKTRLTPEQLVAAATTLAGPIGLALAPTAEKGTRLAGLLPPAYVRRMANRREAKFTVVAVAALVAVLGGVWTQKKASVHHAQATVVQTDRLVTVLSSKDGAFSRYAAESGDAQRRTTVVTGALAEDVDVAALLDQISAHMPDDVWLGSVAITMPKATTAGKVSLTLNGTDSDAPSHWIDQMQALSSVVSNVWVSGISLTSTGGRTVAHFSSTLTLAPTVISHRVATYQVPK